MNCLWKKYFVQPKLIRKSKKLLKGTLSRKKYNCGGNELVLRIDLTDISVFFRTKSVYDSLVYEKKLFSLV